MYLIIGLGNPEPMYSKTRHNMGFDVVNKIAEKYNIEFDKKGFEGIYGQGEINGEKVILLKPQTYMNESGKSIIKVKNFYKVPLENIIVIYDDIDLKEGTVKIRKKGGPGTHNGMRSVVSNLGSGDFIHVRIGTDKPLIKEMLVSHVLEPLKDEQYEKLLPAIEKAAIAIPDIISKGIDITMNMYN